MKRYAFNHLVCHISKRFIELYRLLPARLTTSSLLLALIFQATLTSASTNPLLIPNESFDFVVTPYVSVYEDSSAELTITDLLSREQPLRFTPSHSDKLKFGITQSAYWLHISITNLSDNTRLAILNLTNPTLKSVDLYNISNRNQPEAHNRRYQMGGYLQADPFLLEVPAATTESYLIRIHSNNNVNTSLKLSSLDSFVFNEQWDFIVQGLTLGFIIASLLYFVTAYYQHGVLMAAFAASYTTCLLIYLPTWSGLADVLFDVPPQHLDTLGYLFANLGVMSYIGVIYALGWNNPGIRRALLASIAAYSLIALGFVATVDVGLKLVLSSSYLLISILICALLFSTASQHPKAQRWIAYGTLTYGLVLLMTLMTVANFLALEFIAEWAMLLLPGFLITGLLLAVASASGRRSQPNVAPEQNLAISSKMLSHISHELRSPINGVIGMGELLADTPLSNNQRDFLDTVSQAGRDMLHVVNQVSDLGKVRSNQLELEYQPVEVLGLLNQTIQHFQQEAVRKQIELLVDVDDQTPQRVLADKVHLQSLLHTLINKLMAYTEQGELALICKAYQTPSTGGLSIQLRVTGHITRPEELKQTLMILQHQQNLLPRNYDKLWDMLVLRHVLKTMRGNLEIESFALHGASLALYLPLEADQSTEPQQHDDSLIGKRILIVDDNASVRNVIDKQVKRWGMRTDSTYSGKEALAMMRNQATLKEPFDYIIIDHDMPLMNGLQLSERITSDKDIQQKPARLMLTGMSISHVREEALEAGIETLLSKPADPEQLRQALLSLR